MDMITDAQQLAGWMPIRVKWNGAEPMIDWCRVDGERFTEPFFDHTIERLLQRPFNLMFRRLTDVAALETAANGLKTIRPTGFIFHVSRCGSTLVSRMLASLPQNVAISEASPIDWMIRADVRRPDISADERVAWIRSMILAMAQKRTPEAANFFVKFDAWHMLYFELIERAFPDVPWIFLYREPVEVLVSHQKQRGAATIPGIIEHRAQGLGINDALTAPLEEYPARVLGRIMDAAVRYVDRPNGLTVNYRELPGFVTDELLHHFGVELSDEDLAVMNAAASRNAKNPKLEFVADTDEKRAEATGEMRQYADKYMMPAYEILEKAAAARVANV